MGCRIYPRALMCCLNTDTIPKGLHADLPLAVLGGAALVATKVSKPGSKSRQTNIDKNT